MYRATRPVRSAAAAAVSCPRGPAACARPGNAAAARRLAPPPSRRRRVMATRALLRVMPLRLEVHGVIRDSLRRNVLEPVRGLRGNRDHITFGEVIGLPALNARRTYLPRRGVLRADEGPAR